MGGEVGDIFSLPGYRTVKNTGGGGGERGGGDPWQHGRQTLEDHGFESRQIPVGFSTPIDS